MKRIFFLVVLALAAFALVAQAHAFDIENDEVALLVLETSTGGHLDSRFNGRAKAVMTEDSPLIGGEINVHSDFATIATLMTRDNDTGTASVTFTATVKDVPVGPVTIEINVVEAAGESSPSFEVEANGLVVRLLRYQQKP